MSENQTISIGATSIPSTNWIAVRYATALETPEYQSLHFIGLFSIKKFPPFFVNFCIGGGIGAPIVFSMRNTEASIGIALGTGTQFPAAAFLQVATAAFPFTLFLSCCCWF